MLERLGLVIWWTAIFLAAVLLLYGIGILLSAGIAANGFLTFLSVILSTLFIGRLLLFILSGY